jgi:hypothetical protein
LRVRFRITELSSAIRMVFCVLSGVIGELLASGTTIYSAS